MAVVGVRNLAFALVTVIFLIVFWHTSSGGTRAPTSWRPKEPEFKGFAPLPEGIATPPVTPELDAHDVANAPAANPVPVLPGGGQVKNELPGLGNTPFADAPGIKNPATGPPSATTGSGADDANFQGGFSEWAFQQNLDLSPPKMDTMKLRRYKPHNYKGQGHPTYATYVATPGGSLNEPYFVAAQQLIYRTLWDPQSGGIYPFTAFVAPHITEEQRNLLAAAGAIVRELEPVTWHPVQGTFARWKYQFAKLNMWKQTDFSRIFFLDSDAFPVSNIDDVFDTPQTSCKKELLPAEYQTSEEDNCTYTFMAAQQNFLPSPETGILELNTGVMLLQPHTAMHAHLMREMPRTEKWDTSMADQGFLSEVFKASGAFPVTAMSREYNGFFPGPQDEGKLKVVHEKLWIDPDTVPWAKGMFATTHKAMKEFYESESFVAAREGDGLIY